MEYKEYLKKYDGEEESVLRSTDISLRFIAETLEEIRLLLEGKQNENKH